MIKNKVNEKNLYKLVSKEFYGDILPRFGFKGVS
jgi:hypothetical protein